MISRNNRSKTELNDKERRFVEEYATDFNGTRSAIAAGYSKKTAGQIASNLLKRVKVQEALAQRTRKTAEKLGFKAEDVISGLINIARFDIRDTLSFGEEEVVIPGQPAKGKKKATPDQVVRRNVVRLKASHEISDEAAYAITGISQRSDGSITFKVADKKGALDTLARHMDLVKDVVDVQTKGQALVNGQAPNDREIARRVALLLHQAQQKAAAKAGPGSG